MTGATGPRAGFSRAQTAILFAVLAAGILVRVSGVTQPVDHRLLASWHQADYTQIARNFYRDGLNVLYPKIDWRGDTPGYVEMEFPFVPWVGAVLCRIFGYHEALLRVAPVAISIASLFVFLALCRRFLRRPAGILVAAAVFAANPLLVVLGNALIPDPLMVLFSMIAVGAAWKWEDDGRPVSLIGAGAATAAAILAKASAAYLGFVLAYVVVRKIGRKAFRDPAVWAAATVAVVPPGAWYLWASRFWATYGNSLGVSNEWHFVGWDMFAPPLFLYLLVKWEALAVFSPPGAVLAVASLRPPRDRLDRPAVWYAAIWVFYVVTARTTAFVWSFHYHAIAVAPACLFVGAGFLAVVGGREAGGERSWARTVRGGIGAALAVAAVLALSGAAWVLFARRDTDPDALRMRTCAIRFRAFVPADGKIVVRGGPMFDDRGHPAAHNESMMFAWMDRKGFNYGDEELSVPTLEGIKSRGGRYWIVERGWLKKDDLARAAEERYRRVATCDTYELYDLNPSGGTLGR